jgi:MATE family multidrug resistance protein
MLALRAGFSPSRVHHISHFIRSFDAIALRTAHIGGDCVKLSSSLLYGSWFSIPMLEDTLETEPRWTGVREVMGMSLPIILGSLSFTIMEFTDKWMVSRLGTEPLAAVGSAGIWSYTLCSALLGVIGCVSTFAAQSLGRDEKPNCARYAWQGIYLSILAGLVAMLLWPVAGIFFRSMGHAAAVTDFETSFFRIRLLGYVPMAWCTALAAFFQAVSRPKIPMYAAIVGTVFNAFMNWALIFGVFGFPRLGVNGSATATVLAQYLQMLLLMAAFLKPSIHREYGTRAVWRPDWPRLAELVRIGLPSGAGMFLDIFNWSIFTSFVVGHFGAVSLAAHNAAITMMHLCFMPAVAVNQGIAAIVGQWIGRGDIARAKQRTYTAIKVCMMYMVLMGLVFAYHRKSIIGSFSNDPAVVELGGKLLVLAALFQAFDAINITCMGALRGVGDTRFMMLVMFFGAYCFFLPSSLILAFWAHGEAFGAWIAATANIMGLSFVLLYRFRSERWRSIQIFAKTEPEPKA